MVDEWDVHELVLPKQFRLSNSCQWVFNSTTVILQRYPVRMPGSSKSVSTRSSSYANVLLGGSAWGTAQMVSSRVVTLVASLVFARLLQPGAYATASLVITLAGTVALLAPSAISDLLVSEASLRSLRIDRCWFASLASGIVTALLVIALIPLASSFYGEESQLTIPLALLAVRSVLESVSIVPFSKLRLALRFREIALVEATSLFLGTTIGIGSAALGGGAIALLLVLVASTGLRSMLLLWTARGAVDAGTNVSTPVSRWKWIIAGAGQYIHALLSRLDILIISVVCSRDILGYYAWAIALAFQAQALIVAQLGAILQPVLAMLESERDRQVAAHRRVCRMVMCLGVPAACIQAAIAGPFIRLIFSDRWSPAIPIFVVLSFHMALGINAASVMSMMKARGLFRELLVWQGVQLLVSSVVFSTLAFTGHDVSQHVARAVFGPAAAGEGIPLAIGMFNGLLWAISISVARWRILGEPVTRNDLARGGIVWGSAIGAFVIIYVFEVAIGNTLSQPLKDATLLFVVAPVAYLLAVAAGSRGDPRLSEDLSLVVLLVRRRLPKKFRHGI